MMVGAGYWLQRVLERCCVLGRIYRREGVFHLAFVFGRRTLVDKIEARAFKVVAGTMYIQKATAS